MVVADGRILHNYSLKVNESSLTGESEGVEKTEAVIEGDKVALGTGRTWYSPVRWWYMAGPWWWSPAPA